MTLKEAIDKYKDQFIADTVAKMKKRPEYKSADKCGRMYMVCLELGITHVTLTPTLKRLNIEL